MSDRDKVEIKIDAVSSQQLIDVIEAMNTMFVALMCEAGLDRMKFAETLRVMSEGRSSLAKSILTGVASGIESGTNPPRPNLTLVKSDRDE